MYAIILASLLSYWVNIILHLITFITKLQKLQGLFLIVLGTTANQITIELYIKTLHLTLITKTISVVTVFDARFNLD